MIRNIKKIKSAACLIIGDEVLNGKTIDTNSNWLAKKCFDLGLELEKISIIPDKEAEIISNVLEMSHKHDLVFTSGGIGSTHDDITYQSIAKAFNLKLEMHSETIQRMHKIQVKREELEHLKSGITSEFKPKFQMTESRKRMALLPSSESKVRVLFPSEELWVPLVIVENVHILPGIPRLFTGMFTDYFHSIAPQLGLNKFHRKMVATGHFESDIAIKLTEIQKNADSFNVKIGSYPKWKPEHVKVDDWKLKVVVCVVGRDLQSVDSIAETVKQQIDGWYVE